MKIQPATSPIIFEILQGAGYEPLTIHPEQKGYRNRSYHWIDQQGHEHNLILFKAEQGAVSRIRRAEAVSEYLYNCGWPTRKRQGLIMSLGSERGIRYAADYNYLPGNTLSWEGYHQMHLKLLGLTMAKMHKQLQEMNPASIASLPREADEQIQLVHEMLAYFKRPGITRAMQAKLRVEFGQIDQLFEQLLHLTEGVEAHLPSQVLHMDFVRGNILYAEPAADDNKQPQLRLNDIEISGILDFEKTSYGPRVFDIARTLAFLTVDCKYKTSRQVWKYFLHSGYNKRGDGQLTGFEFACIQRLVVLFLVHDFYKFLCHNPYESLHDNEHFVRTCQLLQRYGTIKPTV